MNNPNKAARLLKSALLARGLSRNIRRVSLHSSASGVNLTPRTSKLQPSVNIVSPRSQYSNVSFEGKAGQMQSVKAYVSKKNLIPLEAVPEEVASFYEGMGIDDMYFEQESIENIGDNVIALYGAKIQAQINNQESPEITLKSAIYIHTSTPGVEHPARYEQRMDKRYLEVPSDQTPYRLESYLVPGETESRMRCYLIRKCDFVNAEPTPEQEHDILKVADKNFLNRTSIRTQSLFQDVMNRVLKDDVPVFEVYDLPNSQERRLVIGMKRRSAKSYFSAISGVFHYHKMYSIRKYVDQFSNGVTILSFYLGPVSNSPDAVQKYIADVVKEASLIYALPRNELVDFVRAGTLSVQETVYGNVGWIFAQHFLKRLGSEFSGISNIVDPNNIIHVEALSKIKKRLRADTFTSEYILEVIERYPDLVRLCYQHFESLHHSQSTTMGEQEMLAVIQRITQNRNEYKSYITFNKNIFKTNFFKSNKNALSFRMNPVFLAEDEYPRPVYGMFFVVGAGFRGFHLRFRDIARGGIRIVKSRNRESYTINLRSLMDENYGLAATQQRKNKDIPEGGSKGTILLDFDNQDKPRLSFEKYVDSILDLLLLEGEKEIVDLYKKPEILFFGPDEGTADMMDWASEHAHKRGASFWNAFTTGKSQAIDDTFGMTTRSVHQYKLGIYGKLGLDEAEVTKLQIGGPDGDLGSNEILISKDKTIGIVDGSGVIYDPSGLDRTELTRLAKLRQMVNNFDQSKLSSNGFFVSVEDSNVVLPDGTNVESGLAFRNSFHLNPLASADVFVPCGGRPESVDISNVQQLFNADGTPHFKYIVEGANLFLTQEARLVLEKAGVIVFKDASANKGGVTSSSLEVLAALALDTEEFGKYMQVKPDNVPEFYTKYVKEVQKIIARNADGEFEALWRQSRETGVPISVLSDDLSLAIVGLNEQLQTTSFWNDLGLRKVVMAEALPKLLVTEVGVDTLLARIPENYTQAIFGSYLASRFVYAYGTKPSQFAFFEFMMPYYAKVVKDQ